MKYVPAASTERAFNCPHCGALAKQTWFSVHAESMTKDAIPLVVDLNDVEEHLKTLKETKARTSFREWAQQMASGLPFLHGRQRHTDFEVNNLNISKCFNCDDIAIWIFDRMVYPRRGEAPEPNPDLSSDIRRDYDEASSILDISPRGAAALLRLSIQKLCKELGEPGKNINDDIGSLVAKGLDHRVQKALDIVRVVGNDAVHPGTIDLRDDRATAENLFQLLNLIAEKMISEPKHVDDVYNSLPREKLAAIEKRDAKK
jgi:hypothetical protein